MRRRSRRLPEPEVRSWPGIELRASRTIRRPASIEAGRFSGLSREPRLRPANVVRVRSDNA